MAGDSSTNQGGEVERSSEKAEPLPIEVTTGDIPPTSSSLPKETAVTVMSHGGNTSHSQSAVEADADASGKATYTEYLPIYEGQNRRLQLIVSSISAGVSLVWLLFWSGGWLSPLRFPEGARAPATVGLHGLSFVVEAPSENKTRVEWTERSVIDLMFVELIFSAVTVVGVFLAPKKGSSMEILRMLTIWLCIVASSKLWMYRGWMTPQLAADTFCLILSMVFIACRMIFLADLCVPEEGAKAFYKVIKRRLHDEMIASKLAEGKKGEELQAAAGGDDGDDEEDDSVDWHNTYQILAPYLFPEGFKNRILVSMTWVALFCSKGCSVIAPIILGKIVTDLSQSPPKADYGLVGLYCVLGILPSMLTEMQDVLFVKVWQISYAQVAERIYTHVHSLSLDWHLRKKMGAVIATIDRGQFAAEGVIYYTFIYVVPALATGVIAFAVVAFHYDQPQIAAVCYIAFASYVWATVAVTLWRKRFREEMNVSDNDMHDKASDSLINFETVKYFANEKYEINEYLKMVVDYQKGGFKSQAATSVLNFSQRSIMHLCMLGALSVAVYHIFNTDPTVDIGKFVAVQAYVLAIFGPLDLLGWVYGVITNGIVDVQSMGRLMAEQADIKDLPHAKPFEDLNRHSAYDTTKGVTVEFKNVRFRYPAQPADGGVHDVSFVVPAGTTTAIVGETGSGKTTLSRLLFRFYDTLGGDVTLNGVSVRDVTQESLRRAIGVVPQDTVMFNNTVGYNLRYGRLGASEADVVAAAKQAQVHEFVQRLEKGYDTVVGERGLKLSGGEKQRLAIARCLLKNPPVVVLDEATSALDNHTEREVQRALRCLAGRTTIVVAHRLTTVRHAEQIIVMSRGRIVERGTHDQLLGLGPNGYYRRMWDAQLIEDGEVTPATPTST